VETTIAPLVERIRDIEGWLTDEAADLTASILSFQAQCGVQGAVLELGVFRGKYLALLFGLTADTHDRVIGIDAFFECNGVLLPPHWRDEAIRRIRENVGKADPDLSRLSIIAANTNDLDAAAIARLAPERYRFVSVDGGHDAETVYHDLAVVAPAVCEGGVLALDDVFNPLVPGVAEGVCRFFVEFPNALAAFATCGNKVFVTTHGSHALWLDLCRRLIEEPGVMPYRQRSKAILDGNAANRFVPHFFANEVVTFWPSPVARLIEQT
jgi:hypothetical protein